MTKKNQVRLAQAKAHDERMLSEAERYLNRNDVRGAIEVLQKVNNSQNLLSFLEQAKQAGKLTAEKVLEICATRVSVSSLLSGAFAKSQVDELVQAYKGSVQEGKTKRAKELRGFLSRILDPIAADQLLGLQQRTVAVLGEHPFDALTRLAQEANAKRKPRRRKRA